jgi:hypothetical protein
MSDLSALSRTSKYYRALAEAHLYSDLAFDTRHGHQIIFLLRTITQRPMLAEHISSFKLIREPVASPPYIFMPVEDAELWSNVANIKTIISKILRGTDVKLALLWVGRVFAGQPIFDGALAIALCMAVNLTRLDLTASSDYGVLILPTNFEVLNRTWRPPGGDIDTTSPILQAPRAQHRGRW